MRNEFCTLFDANYLVRGLVLYRSLARVAGDFRLRALCMDEYSKSVLDRMALPGLDAIALAELEVHDPGLLAVKHTRDPVEYCWTATPAICLYALEREPELEGITYLDADLMFFHDPEPLFEELGDGSILLVPHRYAPEHAALEELSGTFNVEFLTFRRDDRGLTALRWWRERCLEWCYRRHEDGKFGDQKYLDDWPQRFPGVRVLHHPGGGLAPWNVSAHTLQREDAAVLVDGVPLVFSHYHALRLYAGVTTLRRLGALTDRYRLEPGPEPLVWTCDYPIGAEELELVWRPYMRALAAELSAVRALEPRFDAGFVHVPPRDAAAQAARSALPRPLRSTLRRARGLAR